MSKATTDQLDALHGELAKTLRDEIKRMSSAGEDKKGLASLMSVARQFLKDNNVETVPLPGSPLGSLADDLPFMGGDDMPSEDHPLQ